MKPTPLTDIKDDEATAILELLGKLKPETEHHRYYMSLKRKGEKYYDDHLTRLTLDVIDYLNDPDSGFKKSLGNRPQQGMRRLINHIRQHKI